MPIYVVVTGRGEGTFREPENLRALGRLQAHMDAIPEVSATLSLVDFVAVVNRALERDDPAAERVPDTRAAVSEIVFLLPKAKIRRFVNANQSRANVVVRTGVTGSAALRALEARLRAAIAAADLPAALRADVTGNAIVLNRGADAIAGNQLGSVALTTATILLLVTAAFRSVRFGLIALVPNLVPVILFFGLLGGGIATLSLPTSLIGCVALGIAIDDTAHFLVNYRRVRGDGTPAVAAIASCVRELGQPMVVTSVMLSAGYLVLALSSLHHHPRVRLALRADDPDLPVGRSPDAACDPHPFRPHRLHVRWASRLGMTAAARHTRLLGQKRCCSRPSARSSSRSGRFGSSTSTWIVECVSSSRSVIVDSVGTHTPSNCLMARAGCRELLDGDLGIVPIARPQRHVPFLVEPRDAPAVRRSARGPHRRLDDVARRALDDLVR